MHWRVQAPLLAVKSHAFYEAATLKYFDFANTSIRSIERNAFRKCNLEADDMTLDNTELINVGQGAF